MSFTPVVTDLRIEVVERYAKTAVERERSFDVATDEPDRVEVHPAKLAGEHEDAGRGRAGVSVDVGGYDIQR